MSSKDLLTVLMADDDLEDCELVREAWEESKAHSALRIVHDGEELMDYLRNEGKFINSKEHPYPALILLDLNMPKKDGREALHEIKTDPLLRSIPIVILTTSQSEEDIVRTYDLGVNSYIAKPASFGSLVTAIATMHLYWLEIVLLPARIETVT